MKYYEIEKLYPENISQIDLIDTIKENENIKEYYLIQHNYDTKENGERKKPHFHLYIGYSDFGRNTINLVKEFFKPLTENIISVKSIDSALRYGVHLGYNDKYQYDKLMYITNNMDRVDKAIREYKQTIEDVLNDFMDSCIANEILNNYDIVVFFKKKKQLQYLFNHYTNVMSLYSLFTDKRFMERKERQDYKWF